MTTKIVGGIIWLGSILFFVCCLSNTVESGLAFVAGCVAVFGSRLMTQDKEKI